MIFQRYSVAEGHVYQNYSGPYLTALAFTEHGNNYCLENIKWKILEISHKFSVMCHSEQCVKPCAFSSFAWGLNHPLPHIPMLCIDTPWQSLSCLGCQTDGPGI